MAKSIRRVKQASWVSCGALLLTGLWAASPLAPVLASELLFVTEF